MPQLQLPFFPAGVTQINALLAFEKNKEEQVVYFNACTPIFIHDATDKATFKMVTAQFCVSGTAKQAEIVRAFGVTAISVKRAVKLYREKGPEGFFAAKKSRGAAVLTSSVIEQAQCLLDEGLPPSEVADKLGVKKNTLSKAINADRLRVVKKKKT